MITLRVLLVLLCLASPAWAQQVNKPWPTDVTGIPAPPCVTYDPVANANTFCPASGAVVTPTTSNSTAFGQGFFTGIDNSSLSNSAPSFLFLDETTVIGVGGRNVGNANIYRSSDGGKTMTTVAAGAGSVPANNALRNLVKSSNGLYVVGTNNNPESVFGTRDLGTFTATAGALPAVAGNTAVYQAGNTIIITEDTNQNVCRATAPATGSALTGMTCAVPPTWTGPISGANQLGLFHIAPSTGAGTASGIWVGVDKATPANVIRSTNDGASFTAVTTLAQGTAGIATSVKCLSNAPATCLAAVQGIIYRSTDSGATWTQVANFAYTSLGHAFLDYNNGVVVAVGSMFSASTPNPSCPPACGYGNTLWARSVDSGATWAQVFGGWSQNSGAGTDGYTSAVTSPTTGRALLSSVRVAGGTPGTTITTSGYIYGPTIPPQGTSVFTSSGGISVAVGGHGELFTAGPVQSGTLLNSNNTSAATTAQTITLTGIVGFRIHVYEVSARCNTAAATNTGVSLTDAAVTTWSTGLTDVPAGGGASLFHHWSPGYTAGDGATVTVVMSACSAGTSTLTIQADQF